MPNFEVRFTDVVYISKKAMIRAKDLEDASKMAEDIDFLRDNQLPQDDDDYETVDAFVDKITEV